VSAIAFDLRQILIRRILAMVAAIIVVVVCHTNAHFMSAFVVIFICHSFYISSLILIVA
jgi:hypothetical protein